MKKAKQKKKTTKKQQGLSRNQILTVIIVGVAVIILSIVLGIMTTRTSGEAQYFFESNNEIERISIQQTDGFEIERDGEQWHIPNRLEDTDQEAVNQALSWLHLWSGEKVEVSRRNVGLDFPKLSIQIDYDDNSSKKLSIGQPAPTDEQIYVEDHERDEVFLVDRRLVDYFSVDVVNYLEMDLLPWSAEAVNSVNINNDLGIVHLSTESPYPPEETAANVGGWFIEEPYIHTYHVGYPKMQELTEGLATLRMSGLIAQDVTNWDEYGLATSDFTIEIATEDDQITFVIGDEETPDNYYARIEGSDELFTMPASLIDIFNQSAADFHDGYVKILVLNELNELSIESDALTVDITVEHIDETTKHFRADGETIYDGSFREAYTTLAGLSSAGLSESATYSEPEVVVTYTLNLEEGEKDIVLELVDYDEDHYAAFVDQESDFLVKKSSVDNVLVALELAIDY